MLRRHCPLLAPVVAVVLAAGAGTPVHAARRTSCSPSLRGAPVFRGAARRRARAGFDAVVVVTAGAVDLTLPTSRHASTTLAGPTVRPTSLQLGAAPRPRARRRRRRRRSRRPALRHDRGVARRRRAPTHRSRWPPTAARAATRCACSRSSGALLPTEGDQGARSLMRCDPNSSRSSLPGSPADIDTMEDLRQWNSSTNSP